MPGREIDTGARPARLLAQVRAAIRLHGYSPRTAKAYVGWIRRFVRFHGMRHPRELAEPEVSEFLTHLAAGYAASHRLRIGDRRNRRILVRRHMTRGLSGFSIREHLNH